MRVSDSVRGLVPLAASPTLWAAHFLLCYIPAAIWCAKVGGELSLVRTWIGVLTGGALAGIATFARRGWKRHRTLLEETGAAPGSPRGWRPAPHDADTPLGRARFLGLATFLLSALSFVAVAYTAVVALFFGSCR